MRFSMNSYLLGVGTVVGALAFGFGGGILLTKTAIKESPAGPSRIERVARPEPASAQVQVTEARAVPVPRADPAPAVQPVPEPAPQVQAAVEPKPVSEAKPVAEAARPEPAKAAEPVRQVDAPRQAERQAEQPVRQADAPKQIEQQEAGPEHDRARATQSRARAAPGRTPDGARAVLCRAQGAGNGIRQDAAAPDRNPGAAGIGPNSPSNARSRGGRICLRACSGGRQKRRPPRGSEGRTDGVLRHGCPNVSWSLLWPRASRLRRGQQRGASCGPLSAPA